ncbi:MAG: hypothetical protein QME05_03375 [Candidatus Margulisbacteria bacterium]|nr:hypothetical protein [Candidatus Margulisiibacteriota bacterium]
MLRINLSARPAREGVQRPRFQTPAQLRRPYTGPIPAIGILAGGVAADNIRGQIAAYRAISQQIVDGVNSISRLQSTLQTLEGANTAGNLNTVINTTKDSLETAKKENQQRLDELEKHRLTIMLASIESIRVHSSIEEWLGFLEEIAGTFPTDKTRAAAQHLLANRTEIGAAYTDRIGALIRGWGQADLLSAAEEAVQVTVVSSPDLAESDPFAESADRLTLNPNAPAVWTGNALANGISTLLTKAAETFSARSDALAREIGELQGTKRQQGETITRLSREIKETEAEIARVARELESAIAGFEADFNQTEQTQLKTAQAAVKGFTSQETETIGKITETDPLKRLKEQGAVRARFSQLASQSSATALQAVESARQKKDQAVATARQTAQTETERLQDKEGDLQRRKSAEEAAKLTTQKAIEKREAERAHIGSYIRPRLEKIGTIAGELVAEEELELESATDS